ncbi:Uncharacterized protein FKW44_018197 [Caligus rogercresseyi]|uniref:Uncharacterized protein n=1 Tax=Caligus rogercresseyi TaxID=217165 RepID=A0A7T8GU33_CALRO|nr:Uncharacterized protein FKW44_018197 [Caligus rogercresseyi]
MFASFRAGRSPKEVIEFFNYPKSTVYDQWKAWNSFKKNDAHHKKRSRSWGPPGPTSLSPSEEKVNEDDNKSSESRVVFRTSTSSLMLKLCVPGWLVAGVSLRTLFL